MGEMKIIHKLRQQKINRASACKCYCLAAMLMVLAGTCPMALARTAAPAKVFPSAIPQEAPSAVQVLLARARTLSEHGQKSTAIQIWQQVLLADPQNEEALAGLARSYRLQGDTTHSEHYLNDLRRFHPEDPEIAAIESMKVQATQQEQLAKAGKLAMNGHAAQAMEIYKSIYGEQPPDGDIGLAYYETEAAIPAGKGAAMYGLRGLVSRYPSDTRYAIALGRILTQDPATRNEGMQMLEPLISADSDAARAYQQAWLWEAQDPAHADDVRQYLQTHPDAALQNELDATLGQAQKTADATKSDLTLKGAGPGIAQTPVEADAFRALHDGRTAQAERSFHAILKENTTDGPALAGMGFVRLRQQRFQAAERYLELAEHQGVSARFLPKPLATAKIWKLMHQGAAANQDKDWTQAKSAYQQALVLQPESADAGRALLATNVQAGDSADAFDTMQKIPATVSTALQGDGGFLQSEAAAEDEGGQPQKALAFLEQALTLPPASLSAPMLRSIQLQEAALYLREGETGKAQEKYQQVLTKFPVDAEAWQGMVQAQHQSGQDAAAWQRLQAMPPEVSQVCLSDTTFLSTAASVAAAQGHLHQAQKYLQRAMQQVDARGETARSMLMQLAQIFMRETQPMQAAALDRRILEMPNASSKDRYDAALGLLNALHVAGQDEMALQQMQALPPALQSQLQKNSDYLLEMASVDAAVGSTPAAIARLQQVEALDASTGTPVALDVELNLCWLLYRAHQGAALLPRLEKIERNPNLSARQQKEISQIWILWTLRRTDRYRMQHEYLQAIQLQEVARIAFPQNSRLRNTLAGTYIEAHEPKKTVAMYMNRDVRLSTPEDIRAAIGAAMAAGENQKAEAWLHEARAQYPQNPALLVLYAQWDEMQERDRQAIENLKQAMSFMPKNYQVDRPTHADMTGQNQDEVASTQRASGSVTTESAISVEDRPASIEALEDLGAVLQATDNDEARASEGLTSAAVVATPPVPLRNQAQAQLQEIESRLSPWIGAIPYINHRSGTEGVEQMTDVEIPAALSFVDREEARLTLLARWVSVSDGAQSSSSLLPGGTLSVGLPADAQTANGIGGELQLATRLVDASVGTSPREFLVPQIVGRVALRIPDARLTLTFVRDNVRDSELSYAGLRNPDTVQEAGKIWGGVVSNLGGLEWSHGSARKGVYFTGSGGVLTGTHVQTNTMGQVDTGAYWRLLKKPGYGKLMMAANVFGMHYAHDELYFTYGQGGYFSPSYFLLGNVPLTWTGNRGKKFHYDLEGTLGAQNFQQDSAKYFPLDPTLQATHTPANPMYLAKTTTGLNYGAQADAAWLLSGHWYVGGFVDVNDAQNYNQQMGGVSLHYTFGRQHPRDESPTGVFPSTGINTLKLP